MTQRLLSVVGARPQFIKASILQVALQDLIAAGSAVSAELVHTGQHYDNDMSQVFFDDLGLKEPLRQLDINRGSHGEMTGRMLMALEEFFSDYGPDLVIVYGDTNSTLAASLAAAKLNIPIAHVEAGLRHYDKTIPEEINRLATDHMSSLLFCSSDHSQSNLKREGITEGTFVVGDITYDSFVYFEKHSYKPKITPPEPFVACTIHRQANTSSRRSLQNIIAVLEASPYRVVLPMHPRTREALREFSLRMPDNVQVENPISYFEMIGLIKASEFVITDSGGMQKDGYFCGKRVVTLSHVSPWQELIDLDVMKLAGAEPDAALESFEWACRPLRRTENPYGDGNSAGKIASHLFEWLSRN